MVRPPVPAQRVVDPRSGGTVRGGPREPSLPLLYPGRMLSELRIPVIAAPMAGGPSTPQLVAAVSDTGAFGFLAGGYRTAHALAEQLATTRSLTAAPFGVNLFVPGPESTVDTSAYVERVRPDADRYGTAPG